MNKEELLQYVTILRRIEAYEWERQKIIAKLYRSPLSAPEKKGGKGDPAGGAGARLADLDALLQTKSNELRERRLAIEKAITLLPDQEALLLQYRYLLGLEWQEVAQKMNYSIRRVYGLHGSALQKISAQKKSVQ